MSRRTAPLVAIDGPAGAGKSTVSRRVATELGYLLLDTGALYRCVALAASRAGKAEPSELAEIATRLAEPGRIEFRGSEGRQVVSMDGEDVTEAIRSPEVGVLASRVSTVPGVRTALLELQRRFGADGRVVVEGRDIGSVVFPDAEAKFFLTASVEARASRRYEELKVRHQSLTLAEVESEVRERDRRDSTRPVSPLKRAPDAILVDSTELGIDVVVRKIVDQVRTIERRLQGDEAHR